MKPILIFKRLHKWFALLVGIQLILWIVSGIAFSFINHNEISGSFIFKNQYKQQSESIENIIDFETILGKYPSARSVVQFRILRKNLLKIQTSDSRFLLDADTKKVRSIDKQFINRLVLQNYRGGGALSIELISETTDENKKFELPSWRASFADEYGTNIYFSTFSGEYQGIRTDSWRLNDFFFMLHFMDYGQRGNFNHWLIILAALVLVFFSISGLLLIYSSFSRKDLLHLYTHFFSHNLVKLTVLDKQGGIRILKVEKDERLMDALAKNKIELESICGGGGICGCCRIKQIGVDENVLLENLINQDTLSNDELRQGYRLACQLLTDADITIQIE